ncbi:MAG: deoxyuridine 5'-triphosphate nucleotidohydrolase [Halobacteriota archaeon]|nr:deoxyuridine 5'-triphosphate nucleotidohydrolase [Halobacteriota archaeon]
MVSVLSKDELKIELKKGLVENLIDPDKQLQVNGIDLSVSQIEVFEDCGRIAFDNSERVISSSRRLDFNDEGWIHLPEGCYKVIFNEVVDIPRDMCAIGKPRSSLLRSGCTVASAVWDAGYKGRSESLLIVKNRYGIHLKRDACILQLVFLRTTPVGEGYDGVYQNENL